MYDSLLGDVLIRLRDESEKEIGQLIVSTLCLLEVSRSGLLEDELLSLLQKETFEDEKGDHIMAIIYWQLTVEISNYIYIYIYQIF